MTCHDREPQPGVNKRLTLKRRRNHVENDEYAAFLRRAIRAYSRRIASGDIDALTGMAAIAAELDNAIRAAITALRDGHGYSWADIGTRLGITRQAAQQRWGTPAHDHRPDPEWQPGMSDECSHRYHEHCPPGVDCECYRHLDGPGHGGDAR